MSGSAGHNNFFPDMSLAKMHLCVLSLTTRRRSRLTNAVEFKAWLVVRMTSVVDYHFWVCKTRVIFFPISVTNLRILFFFWNLGMQRWRWMDEGGFSTLRLGAQSDTLLSTLRDPTQLRRRQCACPCYAMFEWKKLKFLLLIRRKE